LVCAQEAFWQVGLDRVWLMPTGEPAHKAIEGDPGKEDRRVMTELASWGAEWLDASHLELDRPGATYTVDTLRQLRAERRDDEIVWIMGADQAVSLPEWHEPEEVLRLARVAIARRDGFGDRAVRDALAGLAGGEGVTTFEMPSIDVSSTMVRERVAARQPYEFLVPERVAQHIAERHLYRGDRG
jgi:nicotinate-nucleotide adenylyltransferase